LGTRFVGGVAHLVPDERVRKSADDGQYLLLGFDTQPGFGFVDSGYCLGVGSWCFNECWRGLSPDYHSPKIAVHPAGQQGRAWCPCPNFVPLGDKFETVCASSPK
jgi:hypothetical protein